MSRILRKSNLIYLCLVILIWVVSFLLLNGEQLKKEIRYSKKILKFMEEEKIIDSIENISLTSKISKVKENGNINIYKVSNKKYTLELNEKYELLAFTNNIYNNGKVKINIKKAEKIGEKFLDKLSSEEYIFIGEISKKDEHSLPYYALKFQRVIDKYPYYGMEAVLNIHKETGELVGYINRVGDIKVKKSKVNISKEEARNIIKNNLEEENIKVNVSKDAYIVYYNKDTKKEKSKLAYIIKVDLLNKKGEKEKYNCFVSTETGEIINIIREIDGSSFKEK